MIARFQIDINRRSLRLFTGFPQRKDFRMGLARTRMKPFSHNLTILDNYRTDEGIRTRSSEGAVGKFDAPLHHGAIKCS